jgi:hypothetical protein
MSNANNITAASNAVKKTTVTELPATNYKYVLYFKFTSNNQLFELGLADKITVNDIYEKIKDAKIWLLQSFLQQNLKADVKRDLQLQSRNNQAYERVIFSDGVYYLAPTDGEINPAFLNVNQLDASSIDNEVILVVPSYDELKGLNAKIKHSVVVYCVELQQLLIVRKNGKIQYAEPGGKCQEYTKHTTLPTLDIIDGSLKTALALLGTTSRYKSGIFKNDTTTSHLSLRRISAISLRSNSELL